MMLLLFLHVVMAVLELNLFELLIAGNLLLGMDLLSNACAILAEYCINGIKAQKMKFATKENIIILMF